MVEESTEEDEMVLIVNVFVCPILGSTDVTGCECECVRRHAQGVRGVASSMFH